VAQTATLQALRAIGRGTVRDVETYLKTHDKRHSHLPSVIQRDLMNLKSWGEVDFVDKKSRIWFVRDSKVGALN
jgi:hypothetical protein